MNGSTIQALIQGMIMFLNIFSWVIVINAVLSFFMSPRHRVRILLRKLTEPLVGPFRLLTRRMNTSGLPFDFSPMLALIAIWLMISVLQRISIMLR